MANIFDKYDEENENLTPSQQAREDIKSENIFDKYDEIETPQPEPIEVADIKPVEQPQPQLETQPIATTTKPQSISQPASTIPVAQDEKDLSTRIVEFAENFWEGTKTWADGTKIILTQLPDIFKGDDLKALQPERELDFYLAAKELAQKEIETGKGVRIVQGEGIFGLSKSKEVDLTEEQINFQKKNLESIEKNIEEVKQRIESKNQKPIQKYLIDTREQATQNIIEQKKISQQYLDEKYGVSEEWSGQWIANQVAANSVSTLGSLTAGVVVTAVTKNPFAGIMVGFSTSFAGESSAAYIAAREAGVEDRQAQSIGINTGFASALIEQIPLGNFLNKIPAGKQIKQNVMKRIYNRLTEMAKDGVLEGTTESMQQVVQNAFAREYDANRDLFEGVPESFVLGAILGTGFSGISSIFIKEDGTIDEQAANATLTDDPDTPATVNKAILDAVNTPNENRTQLQKDLVAGFVTEQEIQAELQNLQKQQAIQQTKKQEAKITPAKKLTEEVIKSATTSEYITEAPAKPKKIYRGVKEGTSGTGKANQGIGIYTATTREGAAQYGTVTELNTNNVPNKPLTFKKKGQFANWEVKLGIAMGYQKFADFRNDYPDIGLLVAKLGYDGVAMYTPKGIEYVKYPKSTILKARQKPSKAKVKKETTQVSEQPKITQEAEIKSIKEGLIEGTTEESAREYYNEMNITEVSFEQILAEVKEEQQKLQEEYEFSIKVQVAENNRLLADRDLNQYQNILLKGLKIYNLNKRKSKDDIATISNKVSGFDSAIEALTIAGYDIKRMEDVQKVYDEYLEAKNLVNTNKKRIKKLTNQKNKIRENNLREALKQANKDRGITVYRISQPQSIAQLETLAKEYLSWVEFYRDLTPDNRAIIIQENNITSYYDWSKWFEKITGFTYFNVVQVQKDSGAEQRAIELYGTTYNPKRAGFITSDAQMIDTGGYPEANERNIDHREIAQDSINAPEGTSGNEALIQYMNQTGNIRITSTDSYSLNVDIVYTPNAKQMKLLKSLAQNKTIYVDISLFDGRIKDSAEFTNFKDFSRWVYLNTNGEIDAVLSEEQSFVKDIYEEAMVDIPFDENIISIYYKQLFDITNETSSDSKLNEINKELDRLIVDIQNPKITNIDLHIQAQAIVEKYLMWKNTLFRTDETINEYKFRAEDGDDALIADPNTQRLTTVFLQMPEIKNALIDSVLSKGQIKNILKKAQGRGMTGVENQLINDLLDTTFKNVDKILILDLKTEIKNNLLGIEIYEWKDYGSYADYGGKNVFGRDYDDYNYTTNILNTKYNHWQTEHFDRFWRRFNTPQYEVYNSEGGIYETKGEFAHYRDAYIKKNNERGTNVLEIQSDPFQDGVGVFKPYVQLRRKIATQRDQIAEKEKQLAKLKSDLEREPSWNTQNIENANKWIELKTNELNDMKLFYANQKEELKNFVAQPYSSKEEQMYQTYKNSWHKRVIKEILYKSFVNKNLDFVRFPTARTIAYIEKYNGLNVEGLDEEANAYTVIRANDPTRLVEGDIVDYDGYEYTVMSANDESIAITPSDRVIVFAEQRAIKELVDEDFYNLFTEYLDEKSQVFPIITVKDYKDKKLFSELYFKQRDYFRKAQDKRIKETEYPEYHESTAKRIAYDIDLLDYLSKNLTKEEVEKRDLVNTLSNFTTNWELIVNTIIYEKLERDGIDISKLRYGQYFYGRTAFLYTADLKRVELNLIQAGFAPTDLTVLLPALQEALKNAESGLLKSYTHNLAEAEKAKDKFNEEIVEIDNRQPVTPEEINVLPEALKKWLNEYIETEKFDFPYFKNLGINEETFIDEVISNLSDDTVLGTYYEPTTGQYNLPNYVDYSDKPLYDAYLQSRLEEGVDWGDVYEAYWAEGEKNDRTIYAAESVETFAQPNPSEIGNDNYETLPDGERVFKQEALDNFLDEQKGVMIFYSTEIKSELKKVRPDLKIVTDERTGIQWYETRRLPQDEEAEYLAFRKTQSELNANGLRNSKELTEKLGKLSKRFFGDTNVKIVSQIMNNSKILGGYRKNWIDIVEKQVAPEDTFYHEAIHRFIGTSLSLQEQTKLYSAASKKFNTTNTKTLEEIIAEQFIKYFKDRNSVIGEIKIFFELVVDRIGSYFKHQDEIDSLYKELAVPAPVRKIVKTILPKAKQPISLPTGTGEILQSTLGVKVERAAIEASIVTEVEELPEYQQMNVKDQGALATAFLEQDTEAAIAVALGTQQPPAGIIPESVFIAVENYAIASGDAELIKALATSPRVSEATALGQRIRMLGERNSESPVAIIADITDARRKALEESKVITVEKETAKLQNAIDKEVSKIKKGDWESFIDSIQC